MSFDFETIFKEQIANNDPFTEGNVRQLVSLLAMNLKAKQLMERSKYLKTKVGTHRLIYKLVNPTGSPAICKTWRDEFDKLQEELKAYSHIGYDGDIPLFEIVKA